MIKTDQKRRMFIVFLGIFVLVGFFSSPSFGADPLNRCERKFGSVTQSISNKWLAANQFCFKKLFQCNRAGHCSDDKIISACFKKLQKASASIERNVRRLAVECSHVELSTILKSAEGLDWTANEKMCRNFGISIENKDDVFLCLKKVLQCNAEQITAIDPLAKKLFEDNNLLEPEGFFIGCVAREESMCGNGIHEQGEECDGVVLDTSCRRLGFIRGELKCSSVCALDASNCEILGYFPPACEKCQVCQECPICPACPECQEPLPCPE